MLADRKNKSMQIQNNGTKNQKRSFCGQSETTVLTHLVANNVEYVIVDDAK